MFPDLKTKIEYLISQFESIPSERKKLLAILADYVQRKVRSSQPVRLNFICTHNSRRSHIAQLWATTAALYYGIKGIESFSGGTEATAVNANVIKALGDAGFKVTVGDNSSNPIYEIMISDNENLILFSKKYDHPDNPSKDFAAIMVCSDADKKCPLVAGASARIVISYRDPKEADGTPAEKTRYKESVEEIGREILYAFSLAKG